MDFVNDLEETAERIRKIVSETLNKAELLVIKF